MEPSSPSPRRWVRSAMQRLWPGGRHVSVPDDEEVEPVHTVSLVSDNSPQPKSFSRVCKSSFLHRPSAANPRHRLIEQHSPSPRSIRAPSVVDSPKHHHLHRTNTQHAHQLEDKKAITKKTRFKNEDTYIDPDAADSDSEGAPLCPAQEQLDILIRTRGYHVKEHIPRSVMEKQIMENIKKREKIANILRQEDPDDIPVVETPKRRPPPPVITDPLRATQMVNLLTKVSSNMF